MTTEEQLSTEVRLATFERYARTAGANVLFVSDEESVGGAILSVMEGRLVCTREVKSRYSAVCELIERSGTPLLIAEEIGEPEATPSELAALLAGGTGIVMARAGVAETGSLVLADDALPPRLLSMLADVCIVIISASGIVPGLDQAGELLAELDRNGHRYISLVTGPSRTADIERVLTIGVQGPKALHVVVVRD